NTLRKLENAGYVHIRPDWEDARQKLVTISPSGLGARDIALTAIGPIIAHAVDRVGFEYVRPILPVLRELRIELSQSD
ncbi:MAG: MarR family transcriptional regulator, partial [Octadecabacter sp.]